MSWPAKMRWPSMHRCDMLFFVQTSTLLPPSMHLKFTKYGRSCMQNNQIPIKTYVKLEDIPNVDGSCSSSSAAISSCLLWTWLNRKRNLHLESHFLQKAMVPGCATDGRQASWSYYKHCWARGAFLNVFCSTLIIDPWWCFPTTWGLPTNVMYQSVPGSWNCTWLNL